MAIPIAGIIKELFTGGVTDLVDEVITNKEEAETLKNELRRIEVDMAKTIEQEVSARWAADMSSDNKLSKTIRPAVLGGMFIALVTFTLADAGYVDFNIKDSWLDLWTMLGITTFGAYFGSKGFERIADKKYKK